MALSPLDSLRDGQEVAVAQKEKGKQQAARNASGRAFQRVVASEWLDKEVGPKLCLETGASGTAQWRGEASLGYGRPQRVPAELASCTSFCIPSFPGVRYGPCPLLPSCWLSSFSRCCRQLLPQFPPHHMTAAWQDTITIGT